MSKAKEISNMVRMNSDADWWTCKEPDWKNIKRFPENRVRSYIFKHWEAIPKFEAEDVFPIGWDGCWTADFCEDFSEMLLHEEILVFVITDTVQGITILVNTEGYSYPRYTASLS